MSTIIGRRRTCCGTSSRWAALLQGFNLLAVIPQDQDAGIGASWRIAVIRQINQ